MKAHFPDYTQRQLLARAINNVHNGTNKFGVRIDDKLGYGEILPYFAMTYHLGPNPPNPIYDEWERALGPPTPAASASGSSSPPATTSEGSSSSPDSPAPSVHGITAGSNSGDSGSSSGVVIGVVAAVVVVGAVIVLLVMRSRRGARRG